MTVMVLGTAPSEEVPTATAVPSPATSAEQMPPPAAVPPSELAHSTSNSTVEQALGGENDSILDPATAAVLATGLAPDGFPLSPELAQHVVDRSRMRACAACRRAKTACDETRPCPRCVRLKIECYVADVKPKKTACINCHKAKTACDGNVPCGRCTRLKVHCHLPEPKKPGKSKRPRPASSGIDGDSMIDEEGEIEIREPKKHKSDKKQPTSTSEGDQQSAMPDLTFSETSSPPVSPVSTNELSALGALGYNIEGEKVMQQMEMHGPNSHLWSIISPTNISPVPGLLGQDVMQSPSCMATPRFGDMFTGMPGPTPRTAGGSRLVGEQASFDGFVATPIARAAAPASTQGTRQVKRLWKLALNVARASVGFTRAASEAKQKRERKEQVPRRRV